MDCICETCRRQNCPDRRNQGESQIVIACNFYLKQTIGDQIRAMFATDEGMAKILMSLDISLAEDGREFTHLYCDGKNNCITGDDDIICTDEMRTACILRWLQQPAKEDWP